MCDDGLLKGGTVEQGYIKPAGRAWQKIRYADINGRAVFEGCILLGKTATYKKGVKTLERQIDSNERLLQDASAATQGVGILGEQFRWPNRTIPYVIADDIPNPKRIDDAVAAWQTHTSIRFVPRSAEEHFVDIVRTDDGCASSVGCQGGRQELILRDDCSTGNIIHELGHTIGLWHEHTRADRDNFVTVIDASIDVDLAFNFDKHIDDGVLLGAYDYASIMHYPASAFPVNSGDITIVPKTAGVTIGQRERLSPGDIAAVEALYAGIPHPSG
jgi:hypothetical protein